MGTEVWRTRIELAARPVGGPNWPAGIRVRTLIPADAATLHSLLVHGYRHGGGSVDDFDTWFTQTTTDEEFDPELVFLAESDDVLAGAAICWSSAFIKDLVVHESCRRRGLGEALLRHIFN